MPRYHELEQRADDLGVKMQALTETAVAESRDMTASERDAFYQMLGEQSTLANEARAQREAEVTELRAAAPAEVETTDTHADSADFRNFLRTGEQRASLSTTDGNGGYLVPEPEHKTLVDLYFKNSPIMSEATVYQMTGDVKLYIPKKLTHGAVGWVAETDARGETNSPTLGNITLEAFELYANAYATQAVLDTVVGAEQMLLEDIAGSIAQEAEVKFCLGTGTAQPTGIWSTAAQSIYTPKVSSTNDALDAAQFFTTHFALKGKFQANAKWYMAPATLAAMSQLAWPNIADKGLVDWNGNVPTILGKPVVTIDDAPAVANGAFPAAYGDLRQGYAVGIHRSLSVLRDPYSAKPYVTFYNLTRIGGVPTDPNAVLLMKSDAS